MALTRPTSATPHQRRVNALLDWMKDERVDAVVLFDAANIFYTVGYWTILSPMFLQACVVTESTVDLIIPELEEGAAEALPIPVRLAGYRNYPLRRDHEDAPARQFLRLLDDVIAGTRTRVIGADLDAARAPAAKVLIARSSSATRDAGPVLRRLRAQKDPMELSLIRRAAEIVAEGVNQAREHIAAGVSEAMLAGHIAHSIWSAGGIPTHIVVGSGPRSALAHPEPTERRLEAGELILIDVGALYRGYWAEIARTYATAPTSLQERWHAAVLDAQTAAFSTLAPGVKAEAVDAAARGLLLARGYDGVHFNHAAGHGLGVLGMDAPSIAPESSDIIPESCAVTLEPAAYCKGSGGVRIEDTFVVAGGDVKNLTGFVPRGLDAL